MNKNGNGIDHLTRDLLRSAVQEPSPGLTQRIMERITREALALQKQPVRVRMKPVKTIPLVITGVAAYLFALLILFFCLQTPAENVEWVQALSALKEKLPYILTVIAIVGAFPFFSTLDKALSS